MSKNYYGNPKTKMSVLPKQYTKPHLKIIKHLTKGADLKESKKA